MLLKINQPYRRAKTRIKHESGKKAVDPAKMMNAMFASTRPAASLIKELYVSLDEGVNRFYLQRRQKICFKIRVVIHCR